jgi:hypothetical protein
MIRLIEFLDEEKCDRGEYVRNVGLVAPIPTMVSTCVNMEKRAGVIFIITLNIMTVREGKSKIF